MCVPGGGGGGGSDRGGALDLRGIKTSGAL